MLSFQGLLNCIELLPAITDYQQSITPQVTAPKEIDPYATDVAKDWQLSWVTICHWPDLLSVILEYHSQHLNAFFKTEVTLKEALWTEKIHTS